MRASVAGVWGSLAPITHPIGAPAAEARAPFSRSLSSQVRAVESPREPATSARTSRSWPSRTVRVSSPAGGWTAGARARVRPAGRCRPRTGSLFRLCRYGRIRPSCSC